MSLDVQADQLTGGAGADRDEHALRHCDLARTLEQAGNYEAAVEALSDHWRMVGERPRVEELSESVKAEVLLRAGVLSGRYGSARQLENAQETAKDLISESVSIFETLGKGERAVEGLIELAFCYWREGALNEARVTLQNALSRLSGASSPLRAVALLRSAIIECSATRYRDALRILMEAGPLFDSISDHSIKGKFHNELAIVLETLGTSEKREDFLDRALVEYAAASFHSEQAGHLRHCALVENNLGFLFFTVGKFEEAHQHLDRARKFFEQFGEAGSIAQVDETRARALLAQGRDAEAERIALSAVNAFERGDEQSLLTEALITHGTALARLGRYTEARSALERSIELARLYGQSETAGEAFLALIEETSVHFNAEELRVLYEQADDLLARSQHPLLLARLRAAARVVFAAQGRRAKTFAAPPLFVHAAERTAEIMREARAIAAASAAVLIVGETGTGKGMLARLVHDWSGRSGGFVRVDCTALDDTFLESEFFGTDAAHLSVASAAQTVAARAAGGTLYLDEISALSTENQAALVRLLEQSEAQLRDGFEQPHVLPRIVASTHANLKQLVLGGEFRQDLFHRLETFSLEIPPLRERSDDIPALAEHFLKEALGLYDKQVMFTFKALEAMRLLPLHGNARELRALIERTVLNANDGAIITEDMIETFALRDQPPAAFNDPWSGFSLKNEVTRLEQRFIELALKKAGGKVSHAARLLGFKHHESLNSILKHRFTHLLEARKPVTPRKRSIIRHNLPPRQNSSTA